MKNTSWGKVADWYDELVERDGTYQSEVILPNLMRLVGDLGGKRVLDLACGQGFFARALTAAGATVSAADISPELVSIAKKNAPGAKFYVAPADKLAFASAGEFDLAIFILAIQNIKETDKVFSEIKRVMKLGGKILVIMNHPAFRVPKRSSWGSDDKRNTMYRRLDAYMSESSEKILMNPGKEKSAEMMSFHRPLQYYFKIFAKYGLRTVRLEEWISNKKSQKGPRQAAEDKARKEFPLFLCLVLEKM